MFCVGFSIFHGDVYYVHMYTQNQFFSNMDKTLENNILVEKKPPKEQMHLFQISYFNSEFKGHTVFKNCAIFPYYSPLDIQEIVKCHLHEYCHFRLSVRS